MGKLSLNEAFSKVIKGIKSWGQKKLLRNTGSSSHRMWVLTPNEKLEITKEKYDELLLEGFTEGKELLTEGEKYYWVEQTYFKRISDTSAMSGKASGPTIGIVTKENRDAKVEEGLIEKDSLVYNNFIEHGEPTNFTIMCRDRMGRAVVENGTEPFHIVNKRQVEEALELSLKNKVTSINKTWAVYGKGKNG